MKVVFFQRHRLRAHYSIEGYFDVVRTFLPAKLTQVVANATYESRGVWKRVYNLLEAVRRQGDVNHIVGDIHYVTYLLRKNRTILTICDCAFEERSSIVRRTLIKWLWISIPVARAAIVTTISDFTRNRVILHAGCDPRKVRVVHACISPTYKPKARSFRRESPVILQVGTRPNKNLERVVQALHGVACELYVIGELTEPQKNALRSVKYRNSAHLNENALYNAYVDADLVVFASTYEGFGMPIIEANAVGRPIVTSCVASMPEVAGDAACLVDPFDVESIRAGILRVINDDDYREGLISRGYENAKRFDAREVASRYMGLYEEISGKATGVAHEESPYQSAHAKAQA